MRAASLTGLLLLSACLPATPPGSSPSAPLRAGSVRSQAVQNLQARFVESSALPPALLASLTRQAQDYADEVSRRREIDFFRLHANPLGLELKLGGESSWLLSYLGSSRAQAGLNLELRVLASDPPGMNLNFSGPVTLSRAAGQPETRPARQGSGFGFELITGLPGGGVTEAYSDLLEALAAQLRSRYQARPFAFDDAPLVYALNHQGQLQGFVFFNQGNRLILGERKYADVQSVVLFSPQRRLLAAYTLIGFNPKTPETATDPVYRIETDPRLGELVEFGEL